QLNARDIFIISLPLILPSPHCRSSRALLQPRPQSECDPYLSYDRRSATVVVLSSVLLRRINDAFSLADPADPEPSGGSKTSSRQSCAGNFLRRINRIIKL